MLKNQIKLTTIRKLTRISIIRYRRKTSETIQFMMESKVENTQLTINQL